MILYNACGNDLPKNAVMVTTSEFQKTVQEPKEQKKQITQIDTARKESSDINISNKKEVLIAKRQELDIKITGKNYCYNSEEIDSILNTVDLNYKSADDIRKTIIEATGKSACWEFLKPGLAIEVTEVFEKKEEKVIEEPQGKKIVEKKAEQTKTPAKQQIPKKKIEKSKTPSSNKVVSTVLFVKAGNYKTCKDFAKGNGIISAITFCKMNGMELDSKLSKDDVLGIPYSPK